jgi:hypothetical protein
MQALSSSFHILWNSSFTVNMQMVVPQLTRLVAGFPPRRPGFDPSSTWRFVVDKVALGQVSSEYFGFPCQFSFHQMLHTHLSSRVGTIRQLVADVPSGLSHFPERLKNNYYAIRHF